MDGKTEKTAGGKVPAVPEFPGGIRFYVGLVVFVLSLVTPAFIPLVLKLPLSTTMKGTLSTLLVVGIPDLLTVLAVVLLGKETLVYFMARIRSFFRWKRPARPVGRLRYSVGLVMFWLPVLVSLVELNYEPLRSLYGEYFYSVAIAWNLVFVASLLVLGADFWDKLRALFVHNARAVFPQETGMAGSTDNR